MVPLLGIRPRVFWLVFKFTWWNTHQHGLTTCNHSEFWGYPANNIGFSWLGVYIWVNYNISLTWIKAIWGWFPLLTLIPVRLQWGRYNLPRYIYIYSLIIPIWSTPKFEPKWTDPRLNQAAARCLLRCQHTDPVDRKRHGGSLRG